MYNEENTQRKDSAMAREFELKYQASPEILEKILKKYDDFVEISMETTYYDTPERDLKALRWTLRRRLENGRSVCSLKTPGDFIRRGEWEVEAPSLESVIGDLLALGAPEELGTYAARGLSPVCGAKFTRQAALLTLPEGTVELALDQGVFLGGGREQPFAEIEVELKSGSEEAALTFGARLAREYCLAPETKGKVERAMALA